MILQAALLGRELTHSLSKPLHEALFPILRQSLNSNLEDIDYQLIEIYTEAELQNWLERAFVRGYQGANVTYPYKNAVAAGAKTFLGVADRTRSANTLRFDWQGVSAASTDGSGFINALTRELPAFDLQNYHMVLLGSGGAARAVSYALFERWMPMSLTIASRRLERALALRDLIAAEQPGPEILAATYDMINPGQRKRSERYVVINATPAGQLSDAANVAEHFEWHDADVAIDLVYNPVATPFLKAASDAGATTVGGLGMLIEQAALSQHYWMKNELREDSPLSEQHFTALKDYLTSFTAVNA